MGYDLHGEQGYFRFGSFAWMQMLSLAKAYGWEPMGAVESDITWREQGPEAPDEPPVEPVPELGHSPAASPTDAEMNALFDERERVRAFLDEHKEGLLSLLRHTSLSRPPEWAMSYCWNSGNRVCDADALMLADALEAALPDVPDHFALDAKTVPLSEAGPRLVMLVEDDDGEIRALVDAESVGPWEYFGGRVKQKLRDFIAYCRQGGFEIW